MHSVILALAGNLSRYVVIKPHRPISTEFLRMSGHLRCRSDDVELSTETVAWSCSHHLRLCTFTEDISFLRVPTHTAQ